MVSLSDTAKQVSISSLKQEATEAAFRALPTGGAHDAFKQIFDDVAKSNDETSNASKDVTPEKPKHDCSKHGHAKKVSDDDNTPSTPKVERHHSHKKSTCDDADDVNTNANANSAQVKRSKTCKAADDACEGDKEAGETDSTKDITAAQADAAPLDETVISSEVAADFTVPKDVTPATQHSESAVVLNPLIVVQLNGLINKPFTGLKSSDQNSSGPKIDALNTDGTKLGASELNAADSSALAANAAPAFLNDAQKTAAVKEANAHDANTASPDEATAFKDILTKDSAIAADVKKDTVREAGHKHAEILEMLQGQNPANPTPPAAGDRAISVAFNATNSSAPTLNGSASGGSPILAKDGVASVSQTATGLEGLPHAANDQASFAGTLHNVKDAKASIMLPAEQVAVHLNRFAKNSSKGDISQFDLQLHPAELGRVDIRLEIGKDGSVQAMVSTDNQQTFDMLQKDQRALERALQQAGLQTDSNSLSFSLRQGQGDNQQAKNGTPSAWNKWQDTTKPEEIVQSKVLAYDIHGNAGRVDVRI